MIVAAVDDRDASLPPDIARGVLPVPCECSKSSAGQDRVCVHVAGELDVATVPQLQRALQSAQSQARLVIVVHELPFIDSDPVRLPCVLTPGCDVRPSEQAHPGGR